MRASNLNLGDIVVGERPFSEDVFNHEIVTQVNDKEVKLVRVYIKPGIITGVTNQIVPFIGTQERTVRRNANIPIQIVRRGS